MPPGPKPTRSTTHSPLAPRYTVLGQTAAINTKMPTQETTSQYYETDYTESYGSTTDYIPANGKQPWELKFALAAGLGITSLLVILLLIALGLVLYEKHYDKKHAEKEENESGAPAVPKRPDELYIDDNSHELGEFSNLRRDQSTASYNYVTPEAVRIAMVPKTRVTPRVKSRRDGEDYYSVVQDSSPSPNRAIKRDPKHGEDPYYFQFQDEGEKPSETTGEKENPYYMQVEEGGKAIYVNAKVDARKSNPSDHEYNNLSPRSVHSDSDLQRGDSQNDYYSKVHTLRPSVSENTSESNNNGGHNNNSSSEESEGYSFPPDRKVDLTPACRTSAQESRQSSDGDSKLDSKDDGRIYMNFRK